MVQDDKTTLAELDGLVRRLQKDWQGLRSARQEWDFKKALKQEEALSADLGQIQASWAQLREPLTASLAQLQDFVASDAYVEQLEAALAGAGVPLQGAFPNYEFPPFELSFNFAEQQAHLKLGRARERTTALEPAVLAAWVAKRYKRITDKKFDAERFLKELLACYKLANQLTYREAKVLWGNAVPLETVYELLTVRLETRKEYPKTLFIYELARLKENFTLKSGDYVFELGFARNQGKAYTLVDSQGRESRISSLIVYQE